MKNSYKKRMAGTLLVTALGSIAVLWPTVGGGKEWADREDAWARYEIILTRNIFSRQRVSPRQREFEEQERPPQVMPNPESYFRLKGIVQEDGVFIAFIEDTRSSSVLRLRQGQSVARGIVKSLTLDSIEYEFADKTVLVELGRDLEGGLGAVTSTELLEWDPSEAGPSDTSTEPATGEEADLLKKLMERRQQELGG